MGYTVVPVDRTHMKWKFLILIKQWVGCTKSDSEGIFCFKALLSKEVRKYVW